MSGKAPEFEASQVRTREKIAHKGLTGVPTGPKQSQSSGRQSEAFRAFEAAESVPHIFIPDSSLPAMHTTHSHLAKRLKVQEQDVFRGEYAGWRIVFPDSEFGRQYLEYCYDMFNLELLFGSYVLDMQRFPYGSPGHTSTNHTHGRQPARSESSPQTAEKETQDMPQPDRPHSSDLNLRKTAGLGSARSSPTMTRMDKDDSSSALTGSDSSASKGSKCHICKTRAMSAVEALVPCSTCVRKYHRRCHPGSSPPIDSESLSAWQCRRCVRLQVAPKSGLSNASFPAASPVPSVGQPGVTDSPAIEMEREPETDQHQAEQLTNTASAPSSKPSQAVQNDGADAAAASLSEADDLVEKSFAQLGDIGRGTEPPKKTGRLAFVRKKIEPPKEVLGEARAGSSVDQGPSATGDEGFSKAKRKLDTEEPISNKRRAQETSADGVDGDMKTNSAQLTGNSLAAHSASSTMEIDDTGNSEDGIRTTQPFPPMPQPKSSKKPVPPHLQKPRDSSEPKGKPHKWSGGGTEKEIIQERLRDRVHRENQIRHGQYQSSSVDDVREMQNENQTNGTGRQVNSSSPNPQSSGTAASAPGNAKRRPGPRAKNDKEPTRPCVKCGNPARVGPAGDNTLCVPCRKVARENPAAQGVDTMPPAPGAASAPGEISQPNFAVGTSAPANDQDDQGRTGVATSNVEESRVDDTFDGRLKKVTSRTACSFCSKKRKKCTHTTDPSDVGNTNTSRSLDETQTYDVEQSPTEPTDSNAAVRDGKDADEEAQPGEGGADVDAPAGPKRKCYRSKPKDKFDLGDGWNRPLGTYEKLIGMALCSTKDLRMKYNEVVQWVADNVPNYNLKEGNNWESNIKATISLRRYQSEENPGLWRTRPVDPLHKAKGNMVELLPGLEKSMLHWDPVLKTPRSPMKLDGTARAVPTGERKDGSQESHEPPPSNQKEKSRPSHRQGLKTPEAKDQPSEKQDSNSATNPIQPEIERADTDMQDRADGMESGGQDSQLREAEQQVSSDDEPLSRRKHSRLNGSSAHDEAIVSATNRALPALDGEEIEAPRQPDSEDQMEQDTESEAARASALAVSAAEVSRSRALSSPNPHVQPKPVQNTSRALSLAEMIHRESQQHDWSALSLFEEWPEYDPSNKAFDRAAKIAEIQARPRRKQRFRAPLSRDSRTGLHIPYAPATAFNTSAGTSASFGRPNQSPSKTQRTFGPFQLENAESNLTMCDTWEEFFDLPSNPIPIMHEGQLAYRDGTRNEDGLLPRAKVIFKTGYA